MDMISFAMAPLARSRFLFSAFNFPFAPLFVKHPNEVFEVDDSYTPVIADSG
jgi:hypothetical protein